MHPTSRKGFTLIELLIVIAVIAILAAVAVVALDPLQRFQDARDSARVTDATAILSAIKIDQVDNGGSYVTAVDSAATGTVYMITTGQSNGCDDNNAQCDTNATNDTACVDLSALVTEGYLAEIPQSPDGSGTWDDGSADGEEGTGYTMQKSDNGSLTIRACESENTTEISVTR